MTSVKEKMKSDFLHQEQEYIFLDTTGHAYFPGTIGHTSLLCYVACQCTITVYPFLQNFF